MAGGTIARGETKTHVLNLDERSPTWVMLMYTRDLDLDLALISPSGRRWRANADSTARGMGPGDFLDMQAKFVALEAPEVGPWTAEVSALHAPDTAKTIAYFVTVMITQSSVELVAGDISQVARGEFLTVGARVTLSGAGYPGARIRAHIMKPDATRDTLDLNDDGRAPDSLAGDGRYAARYVNTTPGGVYSIVLECQHPGGPGHAPFTRETHTIAVVSESRSRLAGTFRDRAVDVDGNGLFDWLEVQVGVDVTDRARYRLSGVLEDARGEEHRAGADSTLAPGKHALVLRFPGDFIYRAGSKGTFRIVSARLFEDSITLLDENENPHPIGSYDSRTFDPKPPRPRR